MDELEAFRCRLAETVAWCRPRASVGDPRHCLRTPALRPEGWRDDTPYRSGFDVFSDSAVDQLGDHLRIVDTLARARAQLLHSEHRSPDVAAEHLSGGRLLLYNPWDDLWDGAAEQESMGYFDQHNVPPWDTWVSVLRDEEGGLVRASPRLDTPWRRSWSAYSIVISWVHPEFLDLADAGIVVNPEQCLVWADHLDTPFTRRLRRAGLL